MATEGDRLWYQYDFGDDWDHVLSVENVLDEPAAPARCTGGSGACPPEDCGGIGNFEQLATWARSGYDQALVPEVFDDADEAHDWLPQDWQPDQLDLERVKAAVSVVVANWQPPRLASLFSAQGERQSNREGQSGAWGAWGACASSGCDWGTSQPVA